MKKNAILLIALMTITLNMFAQYIFHITKQSYLCTETFTLKPDYNIGFLNDLKLVFAKDGDKIRLIVGSKFVSTLRIDGELIIYLDDVIVNCNIPEFYRKEINV